MSQHEYIPADADDPATYSMALLWMNAYVADDPEVQQLRDQQAQQWQDAGIGDE